MARKMLAYGGLAYILSFLFCINAEPLRDSTNENGTGERDRVVNGTDTWHGKYPYLVAIYRNPPTLFLPRHFVCGGSVLTKDYILTACHCIRKDNEERLASEYYAIAGNDYSNFPSQKQHSTFITKLVTHPKCNLSAKIPSTDLGLMLVQRPFKMSRLIRPVKFISSQMHILWWWYSKFSADQKICYVPGWGTTANRRMSLKLQEGTVELMTTKECSAFACYLYRHCEGEVTKHKICGDLSRGSAPCSGDSGGPLICGGYLFGIVSAGPNPCTPKTYKYRHIKIPFFFADPLDTLDFVKQYVPNYKGTSPPFKARSNVPPFKYPFIVSIANVSDKHIPRSLCAASILTASSVLTTCRCLKGLTFERGKKRFRDVAVISGVSDLFEDSLFTQTLDIIGIHLDYSCTQYKSKFIYDTGIAIVDGEFPFATPHVQPLKMMTDDLPTLQKALTEFQKSSFECVMVTWGYQYDQPTQIRYNILGEWKVRPRTAHECQRKICNGERGSCYDAFSSTDVLCSEAYNHSLPCLADKGGPLICKGYFFGFISDYDQLCNSPNYVQFTSVISALPVIRTKFPNYTASHNNRLLSTGNHIHLSAAVFLISCLSSLQQLHDQIL